MRLAVRTTKMNDESPLAVVAEHGAVATAESESEMASESASESDVAC